MSAHLEIAKERFLDIMAAGRGVSPEAAAVVAIDQADKFMAAYSQYGEKQAATKGCPSCFGSGGKKNAPCRKCNGTGRVAA